MRVGRSQLGLWPWLALCLAAVRSAAACRWAIYASTHKVESAEVLFTSSSHGLVEQSKGHIEPWLPGISDGLFYDPALLFQRNHLVNQDGYGVGWYNSSNSSNSSGEAREEPVVQDQGSDEFGDRERERQVNEGLSSAAGSIVCDSAAMRGVLGVLHRERSDLGAVCPQENATRKELLALVKRAQSRVIFGHIRASTDGETRVSNSHPFAYNQVLWMHNGGVPDKEALLQLVDERSVRLSELAAGDTDSELVGAVFGTHLACGDGGGLICSRKERFEPARVKMAMVQTIQDLDRVAASSGSDASLNFAASDGGVVVVTRYRTASEEDPPSLYFTLGDEWDAAAERMVAGVNVPYSCRGPVRGGTLMVASEPLGKDASGWRSLAKDQLLMYDTSTGELQLSCLSDSCERDVQHRALQEEAAHRQCAAPPG